MRTSRHPADPHSHPTAPLPRSPRTVQEPSWVPADSRRSEGTHFLTGFSRDNTVPRQHLRNTTNPCSKHWKKAAWLSMRSLHVDVEAAFSAGYHWVFREAENKSLLTLQEQELANPTSSSSLFCKTAARSPTIPEYHPDFLYTAYISSCLWSPQQLELANLSSSPLLTFRWLDRFSRPQLRFTPATP